MPKGVVAARSVECRACGESFITDRVGKAAWFCPYPECVEKRRAAKRAAPRVRKPRPKVRPPKPGPLSEDLEVVLRMAEEFGANPRILREAVQAIAKGGGDQRYQYRRLAAASLALAAYIGGHKP